MEWQKYERFYIHVLKKNLQLINFPFGKSFMLEINQICFEHARI